ncbi:MAG: C25 family cysteine peptidase [Chloroflexota bacterium]
MLALLMLAGTPSAQADVSHANAGTPPIRLLSSSSDAAVLAFELPTFSLTETSLDGETCIRVQAAGLGAGAAPGEPELPQAGALLGLPPGSSPALTIQSVEMTRLTLSRPICPAPVWPQSSDPPPAPAYARDALTPSTAAAVTATGWLRDRQVARVSFHPFQYNPARGELLVSREIRIEVRFQNSNPGAAAASALPASAAFERALSGALLNLETARDWRASPPPAAAAAAGNDPATQPGSYKITLAADGLYRLTRADLQAAGLPLSTLDPRTLQLFENGQEIAIWVEGQTDGAFDPGDSLLFYGRSPRSRTAAHNVYWLRWGDAAGQRMGSRNVAPGAQPAGAVWATARWEENHFYDSLIPAADGDHWYAADLRPGAGYTARLNLAPPAATALTATLRLWLAGYTASSTVSPDHHAAVTLNGQSIGQWHWDGAGAVTATVTFASAALQAGENSLTISLPGDTGAAVEGAWLDAAAIDYALQAASGGQTHFWGQSGAHRYQLDGFSGSGLALYDVTDPQRPVRLQGMAVTGGGPFTLSFADDPASPAAYLALSDTQTRQPASIAADVLSNLRADAAGVDYLIVAPTEFAAAIAPLADHRRAQGLSVFVADLQDVYDEFSGGLPQPEAIRALIGQVLPAYVLLVGDGSYDFLNYHGYDPVNALPPYLAMVDPWWGETAADNRYAAVVGDDPLPDVLLGRLPAATAAEAETVVAKIRAYEQTPWRGDWNTRHVFIADDADDAGDFGTASDSVYNSYIASPWVGQRIYLDELAAGTARQETLAAWNRGALLMSFTGHSSWHQWAVEELLHIHDVPDLHNGPQLPVLLSMTCFTGFFHHPEYATLDESLLRLAGGGAVAAWSPSGLGVGSGHDRLHQGFYQAVFTHGQIELGAAILSAKLALYGQSPGHVDLVDTYHLLGDPAMSLNLTIRPWPYSVFLPWVSR